MLSSRLGSERLKAKMLQRYARNRHNAVLSFAGLLISFAGLELGRHIASLYGASNREVTWTGRGFGAVLYGLYFLSVRSRMHLR